MEPIVILGSGLAGYTVARELRKLDPRAPLVMVSRDGGDFYSVKKSRGCGGTTIWAGDKPFVSRNFQTSRVLTNGPIRLVFELGYAPFEAGPGVKVSETKRITLDAGKNFNRAGMASR